MTIVINMYKYMKFLLGSIPSLICFTKDISKKCISVKLAIYLFYLTVRNRLLIIRINNTNALVKKLFDIEILEEVNNLTLIDIEKIYYCLVKSAVVYNCLDFAILFAQIYSKKRKNVKLCFGTIVGSADVSGHAWVELSKTRVIDFTNAYIYCKKIICYEVKVR